MEPDAPQPSDGPDLSFVPTDDIVDEIGVRCDGYVIVMVPKATVRPDSGGYVVTYGGGLPTALGLIDLGRELLLAEGNAGARSGGGGDDDF